jgi:hypothetical protein
MGHDGGHGHRPGAFRVDVTPEADKTLLLVLRATDGPGWEDPGAVTSKARPPLAVAPPGPGAIACLDVTPAPLLAFLATSMGEARPTPRLPA